MDDAERIKEMEALLERARLMVSYDCFPTWHKETAAILAPPPDPDASAAFRPITTYPMSAMWNAAIDAAAKKLRGQGFEYAPNFVVKELSQAHGAQAMSATPEPRKACLFALADCLHHNDDGFGYCGFSTIMEATAMDRKTVRRHVRVLARQGFAEFRKGLWSDAGVPGGAGYTCTEAGRIEALRLGWNDG